MRWSDFIRLLSHVTVGCLIWAFGVSGFLEHERTLITYLLSIATFVVFSIGMFLYARRLVDKQQMYSFNGVISLSFLIKLVMAVSSIWLYETNVHPEGNQHILHYIFTYLVYTAFEVYFLTELGSEN